MFVYSCGQLHPRELFQKPIGVSEQRGGLQAYFVASG